MDKLANELDKKGFKVKVEDSKAIVNLGGLSHPVVIM